MKDSVADALPGYYKKESPVFYYEASRYCAPYGVSTFTIEQAL